MEMLKNTFKSHLVFAENIIEVEKNKLLIGSDPRCDIRLEHEGVSPLHAFLYIKDGEYYIQDMASLNGVWVNGFQVNNHKLTSNDMIAIGSISLDFIQQDEKVEVENIEQNINQLNTPSQVAVFDELDEDFKFEEDTSLISNLPINLLQNDLDYIAIDNKSTEDAETIDPRVAAHSDQLSVQVTVLTNGQIIEMDFYPLDQDYSLNNGKNSIQSIVLPKMKSFITRGNEGLTLNVPEGFEANLINQDSITPLPGETVEFGYTQVINLNRGSLQILVKVVETPPELKKIPFFQLEKELAKELGKIVGGILIPMLLLLFIDVSPKLPEKEIAIVYKREVPLNSNDSETNSQNVAKNNKGNEGEQLKKKERAKASNSKPQKQVAKKAPSKSKPKASRKIASVKTYKFESDSSIDSLFDNSAADAKVANDSSIDVAQEAIETSDSSTLSKARRNLANVSKVGNGSGSTNFGVAGLSSKKGYNTARIQEETVILGSMDPELLRKILQEYIPQFRHCYQKELNNTSESIKGIIDLNFRINKNGSVSKVSVKTKRSQFSKSGVDCVSSVLKLIPFPKPKGGGIVDVRQPLNFFSDTQKI